MHSLVDRYQIRSQKQTGRRQATDNGMQYTVDSRQIDAEQNTQQLADIYHILDSHTVYGRKTYIRQSINIYTAGLQIVVK